MSIVEQISHFGYPSQCVVRYLNNNELNSATTCYFLLLLPDIREEVAKLEQKRELKQSASGCSLNGGQASGRALI